MFTIDAHQHFWHFNPIRDAWITPDMAVIRRDFMPEDLQPVLAQNGIASCVAVQADQSEAETLFLLELARQHAFVAGVVGWVDLRASKLSERLDYFSQYSKLSGFRHILQAEKPAFMLQSDFIQGLQTLGARGFTYDILVFPRHLEATNQLLRRLDRQPFIIDHIAKPYIKRGLIKQWEKDMRRLARYEHVLVKVSGMATEANWGNWKESDLHPYLDVMLEAFGPNRIVYGSDWPVCLLATTYERQLAAVKNYFKALSPTEQAKIGGENARRFYRIQAPLL